MGNPYMDLHTSLNPLTGTLISLRVTSLHRELRIAVRWRPLAIPLAVGVIDSAVGAPSHHVDDNLASWHNATLCSAFRFARPYSGGPPVRPRVRRAVRSGPDRASPARVAADRTTVDVTGARVRRS